MFASYSTIITFIKHTIITITRHDFGGTTLLGEFLKIFLPLNFKIFSGINFGRCDIEGINFCGYDVQTSEEKRKCSKKSRAESIQCCALNCTTVSH